MMTENYISPKLGSITADVLDDNFVVVKQFKHNSLRGDSYWVTVNKLCKKFKTKESAENYAERVRKQEL